MALFSVFELQLLGAHGGRTGYELACFSVCCCHRSSRVAVGKPGSEERCSENVASAGSVDNGFNRLDGDGDRRVLRDDGDGAGAGGHNTGAVARHPGLADSERRRLSGVSEYKIETGGIDYVLKMVDVERCQGWWIGQFYNGAEACCAQFGDVFGGAASLGVRESGSPVARYDR